MVFEWPFGFRGDWSEVLYIVWGNVFFLMAFEWPFGFLVVLEWPFGFLGVVVEWPFGRW